jgi:hypothetical protein
MARKLIKATGILVSGFLILLLGFGSYGLLYAEPKAATKAHAYCDSVRTGDSPSDLIARARASGAAEKGLAWRDSDNGKQSLTVVFIGAPPFSRHICTVIAGELVEKAEYSHLD